MSLRMFLPIQRWRLVVASLCCAAGVSCSDNASSDRDRAPAATPSLVDARELWVYSVNRRVADFAARLMAKNVLRDRRSSGGGRHAVFIAGATLALLNLQPTRIGDYTRIGSIALPLSGELKGVL